MRIPENRIGLHFAMMMVGMAWERLSNGFINSKDDDEAYRHFKRYDHVQNKLWAKLSTEEREFYNKAYRAATCGDAPESPTCQRCGDMCTLRFGHEPTRYCDPCAQDICAELEHWEDADDEWSDRIDAAFPTRSGEHETYATAMKMVGNRHSKGALVALVNWLLIEQKKGTHG